jgi:predicted RND superfamily exporter protein
MFAIMVVMMFLMVPSWSGVFSTLLIVLTSAVTAMGAAGWMGITLSTASAIAPVIILTLAVSDSIHLLVSMLYYLEHGKTKEEAIQEALRINFEPVFWTSITTAVGFLSMLSCDSPPFQDLGVIVAIGVTAAFFLSITLLPALMAILPVGKVRVNQNRLRRFFDMDRLGHWVVAKRDPLLWGIVLLTLFLAAGFFRLELSDNFAEYLDDRYEVRRVSDYLEANIPAFNGIDYLMDSGEEGGVNEPAYLRKLEAFTNWCNEQPEVSQVSSLLLLIKRLNMNMHGDDPAFRVIPENRELVAQYLLLYEMSMAFGQDINATVTPDRSAMRYTVLMKRLTTAELRGFEARAAKWLAENWGAPQPPRATGIAIMFAHISERNIKSMINSTILALFTISFMLIVAFRSLKFGMLSLIPNVMPAIMTFGLWGLLAGYINMAVSFIASMSLGIVVDDTVHFLSKYLRARRELHLSPQEAVIYSFHTVGWGMLTTSVVLSFGFSVLFFSGFAVNSVMGILMAITIVFALIADYFVLSPLLSLIDKKEK